MMGPLRGQKGKLPFCTEKYKEAVQTTIELLEQYPYSYSEIMSQLEEYGFRGFDKSTLTKIKKNLPWTNQDVLLVPLLTLIAQRKEAEKEALKLFVSAMFPASWGNALESGAITVDESPPFKDEEGYAVLIEVRMRDFKGLAKYLEEKLREEEMTAAA